MNPNIVVTNDLPEDMAGNVVWWRMQGNIDLAALAAAWEAHGLPADWLLEGPSTATALRRAVNELRTERRLVRPLKHAEGAAGWAIVQERQQGDELQHATELRITPDVLGRPVCNPPDHPDAKRVRLEYLTRLEQVEPGDIGPWLCKVLERLDGVALRDRGGVYFVPRHHVPTWRLVVAALRDVSSHVIAQVPAVRGEDAVAAFLDAAVQEAVSTCVRIRDELARTGEEALGVRGIATRQEALRQAHAKLARYEELLGVRVPDVTATIEQCAASASLLMLQAEQEAEVARGK